MKFSFSDEQEAFRASLRRFLAELSPTKEVRRLMESESGWDRAAWRRMNQEMGLAALRIPEAQGGQGFGFGELCIVLEEMGRVLLCAPYFATAVLATGAILAAGTAADQAALLPGIASGEVVASLACAEDDGSWEAAATRLVATPAADGFRLRGHKSFVLDGVAADCLVVLARAPGSEGEEGLSFFLVAGGAPGLQRRPLQTIDPTRRMARLEFSDVPARLLGTAGAAAAAHAQVMREAAICLANEMVGGAERLREDALAYALMRVQFGRPIASFQSMKHKQADMLL